MTALRWLIPAILGFLLISGTYSALIAHPPGGSEEHSHEHGSEGSYKGRRIAQTMSWRGAAWLMRSSREREEQPEAMLDALEIPEGATVADVGAGSGYMSLKLSKRVGPKGRVLATDIQPEMLQLLERFAKAEGAKNIESILCTQTETGLPQGEVDLVLMVDVYHECSDPEAVLQGLRQALKPGGRLVLVEYRAEDPNVPIKHDHKMSVEQVRKEVEPAGFQFTKLDDRLPRQHILIFKKPMTSGSSNSGSDRSGR